MLFKVCASQRPVILHENWEAMGAPHLYSGDKVSPGTEGGQLVKGNKKIYEDITINELFSIYRCYDCGCRKLKNEQMIRMSQ
jgi:hypothetical protein